MNHYTTEGGIAIDTITKQQAADRRVESVLATLQLENFYPTEECVRDMHLYLDGAISVQDAINRAISRHSKQ